MKKLLFAIVLFSCTKTNIGHSCRWDLCPYKGVTPTHYSDAVKRYSECIEGTDCYYIDLLHLEYPALDYDALDSLLFTQSK